MIYFLKKLNFFYFSEIFWSRNVDSYRKIFKLFTFIFILELESLYFWQRIKLETENKNISAIERCQINKQE